MKKKSISFALLVLLCHISYGQLESIRKLQQQLPLIHDSLRYVDALNRLAMLCYEKNIDTTFYYTAKARTVADRLQYAHGKADALNNLGVVYDIKGNLQLALRYYNNAYNLYKTLHDSSNVVQTTMNIAMVYQEIGKDQKAIHGFIDAITLGEKLKRDSIMALVWYNYMLMFPDNIPKDTRQLYISKVQQIALKHQDTRVLLAIEQLIADDYIKNGEHDKGVALLQHAVSKALQNNLYYGSMDMLVDVGDLLAPVDSIKAISYYKQGLTLANQKGYRIYTDIFTKKLYDFYIAKKDNPTAFYYSRQLLQLHDEQEKIDNNSGIDYIEYALKDQQLESARTQSKYRLMFLWLAVLLCMMTIVVIIILWRNWKQSKKTAEALRLQFEQSETTMDALDVMNKNYARLIKIVAHDLRNPIGAINAITTMLQPDVTLSAETKELIDLVKISSESCLGLINELMETDFDLQQNFKKEEINLNELLRQCTQLLCFRAKDKNQQLILNSHVQGIIEGDHEKLWRVMNNLIVNAIKFSPENSEIYVETRQLKNTVVISVKDKGMGIPVELQSKVFDPFTTARRKGTQGEQPFGLGLYISKQIIEAHNGKLWLESEDGKGTVFYVELPVTIPNAARK
jgi:signal transduction histidine kinase